MESPIYPQAERWAGMFVAGLKFPVPPSMVAEKILEIADSGTWQLHHPVGPSAIPFLEWRKSMSDEAWVNLNAGDDETWYGCIQQSFGMDTRPEEPANVEQGQATS